MINIRRLCSDDAQKFKALRLEGLKAHPEAFGASFEEEVSQSLEQTIVRLNGTTVLGGFDAEGALKGIVGLYQGTAPKLKHTVTIWGMYVSPDSRGMGLAKDLLKMAVAEARTDCQSIRLSVATSNDAAIRLYEHVGFKTWATDAKALYVNGVFVDEYLMRLDFD